MGLFGWPEEGVYLIQYSTEPIYKIGRTKHLNRRLWEIGGLLPYPITPIHIIYTNAPKRLEKYWHERFAAKQRLGSSIKGKSEWFDLSDADIDDFLSYKEEAFEDGDLFRYSELQGESEEPQLPTQQTPREVAILRVISHVDSLTRQHPNEAIKLANSCNFQISQLEVKVSRMTGKHFSEERAIQAWERDALSAADAKVRDSLNLPRQNAD